MRFAEHAVLVLIFFRGWTNPALFRVKSIRFQLLRGLCLFGSTYFNFYALQTMQLGETITIDPAMTFEEATKLLLVSFDSTLKSNLSVGLPLDMQFYAADSLKLGFEKRIERNDPYYEAISDGWSQALKLAFQSLPSFEIDHPFGNA